MSHYAMQSKVNTEPEKVHLQRHGGLHVVKGELRPGNRQHPAALAALAASAPVKTHGSHPEPVSTVITTVN